MTFDMDETLKRIGFSVDDVIEAVYDEDTDVLTWTVEHPADVNPRDEDIEQGLRFTRTTTDSENVEWVYVLTGEEITNGKAAPILPIGSTEDE